MADSKLGPFLAEVSNWRWDQFIKAEHDKGFTSNQAMIFGLVRACAMQKLDAIKLSLNRLDGKLKTPIKVEYPKIFYLYPNATLPDGPPRNPEVTLPDGGSAIVIRSADEIVRSGNNLEKIATVDEPESDLPSLSLRQTLTKMADYPRDTPELIVAYALQTEQWLRDQAPQPEEIPAVKSVVAAHLLTMAAKRDINAISEVFDQIDGKLAETIQVLGEDIYITSYITEPPQGAYLNKDGVVEVEATQAQDIWANKLGREAIQ